MNIEVHRKILHAKNCKNLSSLQPTCKVAFDKSEAATGGVL